LEELVDADFIDRGEPRGKSPSVIKKMTPDQIESSSPKTRVSRISNLPAKQEPRNTRTSEKAVRASQENFSKTQKVTPGKKQCTTTKHTNAPAFPAFN